MTTSPAQFAAVVAKYRQLKMEYENHPGQDATASDGDYAERSQQVSHMRRDLSDTFDLMLRLPAPDATAIATKLDLLLIEHEGFELPESNIRKIAMDAARLGAVQAASLAEASA